MKIDAYSNKLLFLFIAVILGLFAIACGGGTEEPVDPSEAASSAKADADAYASQMKSETKAEKEFETGSLTQKLEIISPPTAIDVLEGKAQFQTPGSEEWIDVIDAQPIEAGWSIRTLAVSRAVLKFVDGSQLAIKPSTQVTIDKFDIVKF